MYFQPELHISLILFTCLREGCLIFKFMRNGGPLLFNNAPFIRPKELLPWLKLKLYILVNCNKLLLYNTSSFHLKDNILFFVLHMSIKVNILAEKYITRVCALCCFFLCDTFFFKRKKHKRKQIIVYIYRFNLNENM